VRLLFVLSSIAGALPLGAWAARRAGFETLNRSLAGFFGQPGAWAFLALIVLYKLGDAFAGSLTTPFLIKGMGFSQAEVGIVNKLIGLWMTILGALVAGTLMLRMRLDQALLGFGVLQLVSNLGDWGIVALDQPSHIDIMLLAAIAFENLSGGMGTAAFVALLMSLCNHRYSATHYALLSALAAVGRIYVSPVSGVLSETIGWPGFFLVSVVIAAPGVVMVWWMRATLLRLSNNGAPA
jgi:PAT family beta-lactamase induction signal transducer AmpG